MSYVSRAFSRVQNTVGQLSPRGQFAVFLGTTVLITLALTILSYTLYVVSGTAQLDLSRPGYKQALKEVTPSDTADDSYSATGPLDKNALKDFKTKYTALIGQTKGYSAFDPNALSDEQLNLTQPAPTTSQ